MSAPPPPRTAPTPARQRGQLVIAGGLLAVAVLTPAAALAQLGSGLPAPAVAAAAGGLVLAGALAGQVAALRREAGRVLGAAASLTAYALAALVGTLAALVALGRLPVDPEQAMVRPLLAGAVVAAVAAWPLRNALVRATARSVVRGRRTPTQVLEAFGDRSRGAVPAEELLRQLAESLRASLGLATVEVWVGRDSGLARLLSVPHRAAATTTIGREDAEVLRRAGVAGEAWLGLWLQGLLVGRGDAQVRVAPVAYGDDLLGMLVVERARDGEPLRAHEERELGEVARQLAVVLHNRALDAALQASLEDLRRTNDELRASRRRLVSAADAQRRRIERDIHDGAQQHLAALAVNLGLARQLVAGDEDDRAAVAELLESMTTDVRQTIAEVRDLAHGIYPPLLRQSGLGEALRSAAARAPVPVELDLAAVGREGAEVEAALYFCALEALQNVGKHAPGATATVSLHEADGSLVLAVADDGPGFDPGPDDAPLGLGQGRQNMADRVGAVGGTLRVDSAPGQGTRVVASVPRREEDA